MSRRGLSSTAGQPEGAAVIGSGPNGLAAAVTLARAGVPVTVFETRGTPGGGTRTEDRVMPGVLHDTCSAVHPMALASEFFQRFELTQRMEFAVPEASYGHPLDPADGRGGIAYRSLDRTAEELGRDGSAYLRLLRPLVRNSDAVQSFAMGGALLSMPQPFVPAIPGMIALGLRVAEQGTPAWNLRFSEAAAPALLTGVLAHGIGRLPSFATGGVGMVLAAHGHARGWPVPIGGSRSIADALISDLEAHGGRVVTGQRIGSLRELREHGSYGTVLADTSARGLARIAGDALPVGYRRTLERQKFGPGACKVDFVLDGPVPWADPRMAETPTVHLGGTRAEIAAAEREVLRGRHPESPFVLLVQPDRFDPTRNPADRHAIWSYTHVPNGSTLDVSERVIAQIERFAPGFRDRIIATEVITADDYSRYNENSVGGDFSAGAVTMRQLLSRPTADLAPWRTPTPGLYLTSGAVAPGPGVHGLGGYYAARDALRRVYGLPEPELGVRSSGGAGR